MKKTLLILSMLFCCKYTSAQSDNCEQTILDSYKKEFMTRSLSEGSRKVSTRTNKTLIISYLQVEANINGDGIIREITLTNENGRITDFTFNYGSEIYENGVKNIDHPAYEMGKQYYHLTSKNILNKNCKAVYFENSYKVILVNPYDKEVLNVDFDVSLNISTSAWHDFDEIEKEYNKQYATRTIEEFKEEGIHLVDSEKYVSDWTNQVALKMVFLEREAIINRILSKYNSSFQFNFRKFIAPPSNIWDEFYVDPIKYIKVIFENSHNLAEQ